VKTPGIDLTDLDRFQRGEHHEMFRRLRAEEPVAWHDLPDGKGFWNVVTHPDVTLVNRDSGLFSSEKENVVGFYNPDELPEQGGDLRGVMLLVTDPPKHTRYRKLVNKGFTPRMIGLLEQYLEHRTTRIIDEVIETGSCDFVTDLAAELPLQAIAEIMGVPQEDRKLLFDWSNRMIGIDDPEYGGTEDNMTAMTELYMYVNQLAQQRKVDPRDDIVTKLINSEIDGDKLSDAEFEFFMLLLTVAGNETTRNTTAWGMHALMQNPDQYKMLVDNPELLNGAVEEVLRWASPVLHFRRTATADTVINGQPIAKDDKIVMWYISANRDENVFADPFRFDITRTPNEHVAFGGGGTHFCLGANLARAELRILFAELLERIPDMKMTAEPDILRSNFIGGVKHLPVAFTPGKRRMSAAELAASA
jgi:cholest-4-en-3-one 26-monooxygenase